MQNYILFLHVALAIGVIGFVLLQRGKGAEAGASFGGASQSVFGSSGSGNFLTRTTSVLMAGFIVTSLTLAYFAKKEAVESGQLTIVESVIEEGSKAAVEANAFPATEEGAADIE